MNSLERPCQLCGEPMGKHLTPVYGNNDERAGSMGLICPPMLTELERAYLEAWRAEKGKSNEVKP